MFRTQIAPLVGLILIIIVFILTLLSLSTPNWTVSHLDKSGGMYKHFHLDTIGEINLRRRDILHITAFNVKFGFSSGITQITLAEMLCFDFRYHETSC